MDEYYHYHDPDIDYEVGKASGRDEVFDEVSQLLKLLEDDKLDLPGFVWEVRTLVDKR